MYIHRDGRAALLLFWWRNNRGSKERAPAIIKREFSIRWGRPTERTTWKIFSRSTVIYNGLWFYFQFAISFVFGSLNLYREFPSRRLNIVSAMAAPNLRRKRTRSFTRRHESNVYSLLRGSGTLRSSCLIETCYMIAYSWKPDHERKPSVVKILFPNENYWKLNHGKKLQISRNLLINIVLWKIQDQRIHDLKSYILLTV